MSDELKPCPHCGSSDFLTNGNPHPKRLACGNDACQIMGIWIDYDTWQSRPLEDALLKRAEAAEAKVRELEAENARKVEYLKKLEEKIPGLNVDLAKANLKLAELEAASSRWIPVSERLPEISKNVLLYDAWNNKVTNGELLRISFDDEAIQENIYEWATDGCYFHGGNFERITHWKFPQPPKQDEDIRHG